MAMQQVGMTSPASAAIAQTQAQQYQNFARSGQQQHPNQAAYQAMQQAANGQRQPQRSAPSPAFTNSSGMSNLNQQGMVQPMHAGSNGGNATQSASAFYPSPFQKHFDQLGKLTNITLVDICRPETDLWMQTRNSIPSNRNRCSKISSLKK
jgi:hypothetical protein